MNIFCLNRDASDNLIEMCKSASPTIQLSNGVVNSSNENPFKSIASFNNSSLRRLSDSDLNLSHKGMFFWL